MCNDATAADIRKRTKNSFFAAGHVLALEGLQYKARMIAALSTPVYTQHAGNARQLRGSEEVCEWYLKQAKTVLQDSGADSLGSG